MGCMGLTEGESMGQQAARKMGIKGLHGVARTCKGLRRGAAWD